MTDVKSNTIHDFLCREFSDVTHWWEDSAHIHDVAIRLKLLLVTARHGWSLPTSNRLLLLLLVHVHISNKCCLTKYYSPVLQIMYSLNSPSENIAVQARY